MFVPPKDDIILHIVLLNITIFCEGRKSKNIPIQFRFVLISLAETRLKDEFKSYITIILRMIMFCNKQLVY